MREEIGRGQTKRFSGFVILQVGVLESWECKPWDGRTLVVALMAISLGITSCGPKLANSRLYKIPPVLFPSAKLNIMILGSYAYRRDYFQTKIMFADEKAMPAS
jgi:hypothetical protein